MLGSLSPSSIVCDLAVSSVTYWEQQEPCSGKADASAAVSRGSLLPAHHSCTVSPLCPPRSALWGLSAGPHPCLHLPLASYP